MVSSTGQSAFCVNIPFGDWEQWILLKVFLFPDQQNDMSQTLILHLLLAAAAADIL
jgi:hypothetical protein